MNDVRYELIDDGGSNCIFLPILLSIGSVFKHEFGEYKVEQHVTNDANQLVVLCERISKGGRQS